MVALFWFCLRNHMFYFIRINQEYCKCFALLEYMTINCTSRLTALKVLHSRLLSVFSFSFAMQSIYVPFQKYIYIYIYDNQIKSKYLLCIFFSRLCANIVLNELKMTWISRDLKIVITQFIRELGLGAILIVAFDSVCLVKLFWSYTVSR